MKIDLSICPLTKCNLTCQFCYLSEKHNNEILDLVELQQILCQYEFRQIDIYGGEITLLDQQYMLQLLDIVERRCHDISLVSNGLIINEFWEKVFSKYNIAFSLDSVREKNCNSTLTYLDSKNICFSIISLDIDHPNYEFLQRLKNLKSISIKPYSKTTNSAQYKSKMLEIAKRLYNDYPLLLSKLELPEPTRDDVEHYFLFPDGKLYDVTYNNGNEIFQSIQSDRSVVDIGCLSCEFYHRCFNEHYYGYQFQVGECLGRKTTLKYLQQIGVLK